MLKITFDSREAERQLRGFENQVPFAVAKALTRTAKRTQKEIQGEMARVFRNPTRYTMNSLYIKPAKKNALEAHIFFKDEWSVGSSGTPAAKFLTPEIEGGPRRWKSSEKRLIGRGLLRPGGFALPGRDQALNSAGNMSGGQWTQILSGLGIAHEAPGFQSNITPKSRKRNRNRALFFPIGGANRVLGIGSREPGKGLKLRLWFVDSVHYQNRLDFYGVGERVIKEHLQSEISKALSEAMRTQI
jgi:hypothetical protein